MHVFLQGLLVNRTVYIDYCQLFSATLLGVSWLGGSSFLLCPAKTVTVGFTPIIIYFYKVYLNTLDISFIWLLSHV